ncbi:MAG: hypothetical protein JNM90_10610 [Burkholderiales bacterium]|nr:hypothetical protein [Burkholderiales bacterium]
MTSNAYQVVWPRSAKSVTVKPLAPRLDALQGKTIGFVWDYLFRGDEIWPALKEALAARFPGMRFVDYETFGSTHGEDEHQVLANMPTLIREQRIDAIVSGMGC